jgi:hypothetical protein
MAALKTSLGCTKELSKVPTDIKSFLIILFLLSNNFLISDSFFLYINTDQLKLFDGF